MALTAQNIIDQVSILLIDTDHTRWSEAELLTYLNAGQRDIAIRTTTLGIRPAYTLTTDIVTVAGSKQTIPTDCIKLLNISRNMGRVWVTNTNYVIDDAVYVSGIRYVCLVNHTSDVFSTDLSNSKWETSPLGYGKIIEQIERINLEQDMPSWINAEPDEVSLISYWMPNDNDKNTWYCYPPQPNNTALQYVEMTYSAIPSDIIISASLSLGDIYQNALIDYILYKAYSKDDDVTDSGVAPRATLYFSSYLNNPVFSLT